MGTGTPVYFMKKKRVSMASPARWKACVAFALLGLLVFTVACTPRGQNNWQNNAQNNGQNAGQRMGGTGAFSGAEEAPADFIRAPRFFGERDAPNTIIIYTNPQCPPCKRQWEHLPELFARLDAKKTKVIVLGRGFFDQATRLLYTAALLAMQDQEMGLAFLGESMRSGPAPYIDGDRWLCDWLGRSGFLPRFDEQAYLSLASRDDLGRAYLEGVARVREQYGLTSTPSVIVNGGRLNGEPSVDDMARAAEGFSP